MHFICHYRHRESIYCRRHSHCDVVSGMLIEQRSSPIRRAIFRSIDFSRAATAFVGPIKDASSPFHAYRNYSDTLIVSIRAGRATPLFETADSLGSIFAVKFRSHPPPPPSTGGFYLLIQCSSGTVSRWRQFLSTR